MKRILAILLALAAVLLLIACQNRNSDKEPAPDVSLNTAGGEENKITTAVPTNYVRFEMEDGGVFVVELLPEYAPETVANFQKLVSEQFYNGLTFHRIMKGFMIQGGDPKGDGTGSASEKIKGEFATNGFTQNTLEHTRGVISMARGTDPNSASCQFFIVQSDSHHLDGKYAAFGRVVYGMETVDAIAQTKVEAQQFSGERSKPKVAPVMKTVTFVEYHEDWSTLG